MPASFGDEHHHGALDPVVDVDSLQRSSVHLRVRLHGLDEMCDAVGRVGQLREQLRHVDGRRYPAQCRTERVGSDDRLALLEPGFISADRREDRGNLPRIFDATFVQPVADCFLAIHGRDGAVVDGGSIHQLAT